MDKMMERDLAKILFQKFHNKIYLYNIYTSKTTSIYNDPAQVKINSPP